MPSQRKYHQVHEYGVVTTTRALGAGTLAFWVILCPAALVSSLLYLADAVWGAILVGGISFVVAVIIAPELGLYAYFAWQAFDPVFVSQTTGDFTPAKVFAPFLLVVFLLRLGSYRARMLVSRPFVVTMLAFGCYGLLGAAIAYEPLRALRFAGQIIVQVALVIMTIHIMDTRDRVRRLMLATVAGGVLAALLLLLPGVLPSRVTRASMGEATDPNATAVALAIALAAIPGAWVYAKRKAIYLFYVAAVPTLFVVLLKTGSRTGLLAVFSAFCLGALLARGVGVVKRGLMACVFALVLGYMFVQVMRADLLSRGSRERIEEFVDYNRGGGHEDRIEIWKLAIRTYATSPITGFGFGNTPQALQRSHGWYKAIHNSYLGALVDGGPLGLFLFGYGLWCLIKCIRGIRGSSVAIPATIMLVLVLVPGLTLEIHFSKWFWIPATICLLLAEQSKREQLERTALPALPSARRWSSPQEMRLPYGAA